MLRYHLRNLLARIHDYWEGRCAEWRINRMLRAKGFVRTGWNRWEREQ